MRKSLTPIYIVLFLIGATALWYFGHHRPAQRILEAEPKKIYKSTPLPPKNLSVKPVPSDAIQEPREEDTDIEVEGVRTILQRLKKWIATRTGTEGADTHKLVLQENLSVDDPAAAEAFEKYVKAEADYQAAREKLKKVLALKDTDPAQSRNSEAASRSTCSVRLSSSSRRTRKGTRFQ